MPLFHKKPAKRSCFIYHDESGDDIMQVTDLIIGAINNKVTATRHPLKQAVRQAAEVEFGKKIKYWDWNFTK